MAGALALLGVGPAFARAETLAERLESAARPGTMQVSSDGAILVARYGEVVWEGGSELPPPPRRRYAR